MFTIALLLLALSNPTLGKTVSYDWHITWVTAAPDGFSRPVIGVNGQWPCPQIDVDFGDRLIVKIHNDLGNQSTSLHWHGLHQRGSATMDGSSGTTQCPIAPGQSFTYDFLVNQVGTFWWHSHNMGQYPDGLWGPLIVHDPNVPFHFDEEITFTLSDWYHEETPDLIHTYQSNVGEATDGTPVPSGGGLMNAGKDVKIHVKPGRTYYVHIICPGSYPGHAWLFDGHPMTTVEIDGIYVEPTDVNSGSLLTRIAPGQRWGVLIHTKNDTSQNYAIFDILDANMLFLNKGLRPPPEYNFNVTGWLVYNDSAPLPPAPDIHVLENDVFFDDINYVPLDHQPVLEPVNHQIILDTAAANISGISRFIINNSTYIGESAPTLYTALTADNPSDPTIYGQVNPYVVQYNDVVEIILNNNQGNLHPWHLHGHAFQVLERTPPDSGPFPGHYGNYSRTPARRDTIMLQPNAYTVIRFRADNPGVWLWHCHIELHVVSGLSASIIEAPEKLPHLGMTVPHDHRDVCNAYQSPPYGRYGNGPRAGYGYAELYICLSEFAHVTDKISQRKVPTWGQPDEKEKGVAYGSSMSEF